MAINIKKEKKKDEELNYLNKDFNSFQADLIRYAKSHYSDKIQDFSESGLGGLFVDMAAYVGDVLSFYLDHQFSELDIQTAIEPDNIERIAKNAGIVLQGASPSVVNVDFYCKVPSKLVRGSYIPNSLYLFKILQNTKVSTTGNLSFELTENIDFAKRDKLGNLLSDYRIGDISSSGDPINFILKKTGVCISSSMFTETINIDNTAKSFRTITLKQNDINEIISIADSNLNDYYEVDNLAQDTIFESVENSSVDNVSQARSNLRVISVPRRFIKKYSRKTGKTTIILGGGTSDTYDDNIIPNPSDHAIKLFGDRKHFKKISLDPNSLLQTNTLGVAPINTTLTIKYRAGGGLKFNVPASTITNVKSLLTEFNQEGTPAVIRSVRNSVEADNPMRALGGSERFSDEDLRTIVTSGISSQGRIVSKKDLISRVYTMPNQFGKFFRVGVRPDPKNANASILSGVCIDSNSRLQYATDILKKNVSVYLDEFRIIGDAIDILDAPVVNIRIKFTVSVLSKFNKQNVVSNVIQRLKRNLRIETMQIDQPINISELESIVQFTEGVNSVVMFEIENITGVNNNLNYLGILYSIAENITDRMLYPPVGGIFEVRYPNNDIKGSTS
jgi:hypothetical protein